MDPSELLSKRALVWLDSNGALRIGSAADGDLKEFARANKSALVAVLQTLGPGSRLCLVKALGISAVTTPSGHLPEYIAGILRKAGFNCLAICRCDEGRGEPYDVWRRREVAQLFQCHRVQHPRQESEDAESVGQSKSTPSQTNAAERGASLELFGDQ